MNAVAAPAPVLPRQIRPQHVPALHKLAELGPGHWVEAGQQYGFHHATLAAMARLGYVTLGKKVQAALHCPQVTYSVAYLTPAGAAAIESHLAWVALRGVKWVEGCPLPGEMCDPDVDHDHDPLPPVLAEQFGHDPDQEAVIFPVAVPRYTEAQQALAELIALRGTYPPSQLGLLEKMIAEQTSVVHDEMMEASK